jgi:predicted oxidoreductase
MNGQPARPATHVHEAELVIVGAGAAGATAALEAHAAGATFVGLDQLREFGGTAIVSGGGVSISGSPMQREKGIEDSPELAIHDMLDGQDEGEADEAWARFYYTHSVDGLYEWLMTHGVQWGAITDNELNSMPRRHVPKNQGLGLMTWLWESHQQKGIADNWHFAMTAKDLIWDNGRVVGVLAEDKDGATHEFRGRAILMTTGGFNGNLPMVLDACPKLSAVPRALAGGGVGALGSGHEILKRNGAALTHMHNVFTYVYATPDPEDPKGERGLVFRGIDSSIWVNGQGQRFHDESQNGGVLGSIALLAQDPPMCWAIVDHAMAEKLDVSDPRYRRGAEALRDRIWGLLNTSPSIGSGATLRETAERAGIDATGFEATVAEWNRVLASGAESDPSTGRKLKGLAPLVEPPFYAIQYLPLARKNLGGVSTDLRCRVRGTNGESIPGLYAAGELCGFAGGHMTGTRPLEGIMLGGCLFSGRVAGAWAAHEVGHGNPTHLDAEAPVAGAAR